MKVRVLFGGSVTVVCVAMCWVVFTRGRELAGLRMERNRLLLATDPTSDRNATSAPTPVHAESSGPPVELLELRSEITRLMGRQRELSSVRVENEELRARAAARGTNTPAAIVLPADYLLSAKAQWLGLAVPENTVQSFLWAIQHHDFTNLLQTLVPEAAQELQHQLQVSPSFLQDFLEGSKSFPGMRILSRQQLPDGSVALQVEIAPGHPEREPIRLRKIGGEWKMEMPH